MSYVLEIDVGGMVTNDWDTEQATRRKGHDHQRSKVPSRKRPRPRRTQTTLLRLPASGREEVARWLKTTMTKSWRMFPRLLRR